MLQRSSARSCGPLFPPEEGYDGVSADPLQCEVHAPVGLVVLATPSLAFSQGCALCYTQAASATARFIQALRNGILILMIPPMFMPLATTAIAYRRPNQFNQCYWSIVPQFFFGQARLDPDVLTITIKR